MDSSTTTATPEVHHNQWWRRHLGIKADLLPELSGAVGDLGTFIPIVLTLTLVSHLDLSTTLIFTSLYNISTGLLFGLPMPVQPMKAIAAVAVSELPHLTPAQIATAGITTAATLLFLGATGLMFFLYRLLPLPIVRGVQLSQGLSFAFAAVKYIRYNQDFVASKSTHPRSWLGLDGLILAMSAFVFLTLTNGSGGGGDPCDPGCDNSIPQTERSNIRTRDLHGDINSYHCLSRDKRLRFLSAIPAALIVFLFGLVLCFVRDPSIVNDIKFGPSKFKVLKMSKEDWKIGFLKGAIPQIPLSILNSVIAVCKLSNDLFPDKELSATKVSVSVGVMNMVGCWFGAVPVCHGAGGLAGQYRFGARSGASVVFLGIAKLVVGLVFGNSFVRILNRFPVGILGVLLLFAGIELAMASKDMNTKEKSFVMLVTATVSLTGSSAALGFVCGILLHLLLKLRSMECPRFGLKNNGLQNSVDQSGLTP